MTSQFLTGVIEGFYGRPWSYDQRLNLFNNMQKWGLNLYIYSPKDDQKHRAAWRLLYDQNELKHLSTLIDECTSRNIKFVYSIAPGLDIIYSSESDIQHLKEKLFQVASLGCSSFSILFDDISSELKDEDKHTFHSFAEAQCHVSNIIFAELKVKLGDSFGKLFFCPTEYCARMAEPSVTNSEYLNTIGKNLDLSIDFFWTGPEIISTFISVESIKELSKVIRRKPTIWDNLHANDYDIRRVYLGPYADRPFELRNELAGIVSNPNCEYEANFVPLRTLAIYANAKDSYDPEKALTQAIEDWHPLFKSVHSSHSITKREVQLLCDTFYLPHKHGNLANLFISSFKSILSTSPHSVEFKSLVDDFIPQCKEFIKLFHNLTEIDNRELLYSLYNYLWEIKEECFLIQEYLNWLLKSGGKGNFKSNSYFPKIYRGGLITDLQRLLPFKEDGTFVNSQVSNSACFIIRQASKEDEDGAFNVCLKTGNGGNDGTAFYNDPKVLGYRWVGPYIRLENDFSFVLEDDQGICGYVLGALDSKTFYDKLLNEYIPVMKSMYPVIPKEMEGKRDHHIISDFHNFQIESNSEIFSPYPSHLHIDLLPRAQGKGLGGKMIQHLLNQLKRKGSKGVWLEMAPENTRALHFYEKFGFSKLQENSDTLWLCKKL